MQGTDWLEVERRARQLRAQEMRRLGLAALVAAERAGAAAWRWLTRRSRQNIGQRLRHL